MTGTEKEQDALRREFENNIYKLHGRLEGAMILMRDINDGYVRSSTTQEWVGFQAGAAYARKAAMEEAVKILEEAAEESYQLWIKSERTDQLSRGESIGIQNCMEAIAKLKGGL